MNPSTGSEGISQSTSTSSRGAGILAAAVSELVEASTSVLSVTVTLLGDVASGRDLAGRGSTFFSVKVHAERSPQRATIAAAWSVVLTFEKLKWHELFTMS